MRLVQRPDRVRDVVNPEISCDCVEQSIGEGQRLRIAFFEPNARVAGARQSDHCR